MPPFYLVRPVQEGVHTWVCFNGLSLNCTDVTDVEDSCGHWEKRTDENGIEDYEVN